MSSYKPALVVIWNTTWIWSSSDEQHWVLIRYEYMIGKTFYSGEGIGSSLNYCSLIEKRGLVTSISVHTRPLFEATRHVCPPL